MSAKSKTSTTLSFRCPQDMLDAIDAIGREHYPSDKNSKTNSGCDRSKTLFHIIQAGIAAITDGNIQIEVRQSKTDSKTAVDPGELEELIKKLIAENKVRQPSNTDNDNVLHLIKESLADGNIKEAIASSYADMMGQFNGLVDEVEALKSQLQELQLTPPSPVPDDQLPIPCSQLPVTNDQLPVTNDQLPVTNDQLPNDKIPDPTRSQIQNIRTTLDRKNIKVSATQIRKAFVDAGWNGHNYQEIRKDILDLLSKVPK